MARFKDYVPHGVIPATLAAFDADYRFNWAETRKHLSFAADVEGVTAVTINGHASEVHACTLDEQARMMDESADEIGDRMPDLRGIRGRQPHRCGYRAHGGRARRIRSALLPAGFSRHGRYSATSGDGYRPYEAIADATDLPMIVFQYGNELAYPLDTLVRICEEVPNVMAIKDWSAPQVHDRHIKTLHSLPRRINVLSTNSAG